MCEYVLALDVNAPICCHIVLKFQYQTSDLGNDEQEPVHKTNSANLLFISDIIAWLFLVLW